MRIQDARARLRRMPHPLPDPPGSLEPVILGRPDAARLWQSSAQAVPERDAAVLVLLYPDRYGEAHVVLTERPTGELRHSGQISFPGGARDPGDDFPIGTALREAAEEVGLDAHAANVEVLGVLGSMDMRRISGFHVVPVVAIASSDPELRPHEREVAAILRVPVDLFLPDATITVVEVERDGWSLRYGGYPYGEHHIWGATARILGQLGAVIAGARAGPPA